MKNQLILFAIALLFILTTGCSKFLSVEKRRYNKGYYFDYGSNAETKRKIILKKEEDIIAQKLTTEKTTESNVNNENVSVAKTKIIEKTTEEVNHKREKQNKSLKNSEVNISPISLSYKTFNANIIKGTKKSISIISPKHNIASTEKTLGAGWTIMIIFGTLLFLAGSVLWPLDVLPLGVIFFLVGLFLLLFGVLMAAVT